MNYAEAASSDISRVIELIRPVVADESSDSTSMACLAIAIFMQKPDIDLPTLITLVKQVSQYIALSVAPTPETVN